MAMSQRKTARGSAWDGGARWMLYLLRCRDGTFYTGITTDLDRRLAQHQEGAASRYTRGRGPVRVVYRESCASRSEALKRERAVKALSRGKKERLVTDDAGRGH
jgi:putative endonuclease